MKPEDKTAYLYEPNDEHEAAELLGTCSSLSEAGKEVSVIQAESPFRFPPDVSGLIKLKTIEELKKLKEQKLDIVLSHQAMSGIDEISKGDMLVRAKGGTSLEEIVDAVEKENLFFPHGDAGLFGDITLARMLMDSPISPAEGLFGPLREYILSIELVTPEGKIIHSGSRAVKDVAGYEIIGFLLGSGGRCGMISSVTLRLLPKPPTRLCATLEGKEEALISAADTIRRNHRAFHLELFTGRSAENIRAGLGLDKAKAGLLLAGIESPSSGSEEEIIDDLGEITGVKVSTPEGTKRFVQAKRQLFLDTMEKSENRSLLCTSYDDNAGSSAPVAWRYLFPGRTHTLSPFPVATMGNRAEGITHPVFSAANPTNRFRAVLLEKRGETIIGSRLGGPWSLLFHDDNDDEPTIFEKIGNKLLDVFDPRGIMEL
jgi:FAD/FMN-containing dehydrogenase